MEYYYLKKPSWIYEGRTKDMQRIQKGYTTIEERIYKLRRKCVPEYTKHSNGYTNFTLGYRKIGLGYRNSYYVKSKSKTDGDFLCALKTLRHKNRCALP